jgi:hypothetical protein
MSRDILAQHAQEVSELLRKQLSEEEIERLFNKSDALLKEGGLGRPLNFFAVVGIPYQHLRIN